MQIRCERRCRAGESRRRGLDEMTPRLWRRRNHVELLAWLIIILQLTLLVTVLQPVQGTLIQPVNGAITQLPVSGVLTSSSSLVSQNGTFALGFFSSSTAAGFGVGIWYNQLPVGNQTVVWMPQRNVNLTSAASLQLSPGGVLQLLDTVNNAPHQVVWTSDNTLVSHQT